MQLFSFLKKEFVKNVLTLITGSAISQVIIYASILVLTRLFSTELFGVYILFTSAVLILKPIISLQYELAIVLPKKDEDAINIFVFSILIIVVLSSILMVLIILFKEEILLFFEIEQLSYFIYLIPLSTFCYSCINSLNYWNNRTNLFKNIAKGNIVKSAVMSTSQITTGFGNFNSFGLILGAIIGQIAQLIYLFKNVMKSVLLLKKEISFHRMVTLSKTYRDIPVFNTIISFLNTLSNEIPVILITKYFGLSTAGIYGLAIKVGRAPSGIVQSSVNQVFFNKASKTHNEGKNLLKIIKKTSSHLLKIACLIFVPLFILSFYLDIIFGEDWAQVGPYLRILIPWLLIMFISSPLTSLIVILNKQKVILFYDIFLLTFRFIAFYVGYYYFNDVIISLTLFSGVGVFFNIFILAYFFKIAKVNSKNKIAYK